MQANRLGNKKIFNLEVTTLYPNACMYPLKMRDVIAKNFFRYQLLVKHTLLFTTQVMRNPKYQLSSTRKKLWTDIHAVNNLHLFRIY